MNKRKAQDARAIAAKTAQLKSIAGDVADFWTQHLPGYAEGRREGWTTGEVLAALDIAIARAGVKVRS